MMIPEEAQPLQVVPESPQTGVGVWGGSHVLTHRRVHSLTHMYPEITQPY